jgi:hypothetical protein
MSEADIQQWLPLTKALTPSQVSKGLDLPKAIFFAESLDLVAHVKAHWEPTDGTPKLSVNGERFDYQITEDIPSLWRAAIHADALWLVIVDAKSPEGRAERGREVLRELISAVGYLLNDGLYEKADDQLAQLKAEHARDGGSVDELIKALYDFAFLANTLRARLAVLEDEDFKVAFIDEAFALSTELANLPPSSFIPSPESKAAIDLRNRIFTLLQMKCDLIRSAADFKFRKHPDIAKKFVSAYERRRRTALARKNKLEEQSLEEQKRLVEEERQRLLLDAKKQLENEKLLAEARKLLEKSG